MGMTMYVMFGDVQPHARRHQDTSGDDLPCDDIRVHQNGHCCAENWRDREIRACPCGSKVSERQHEQGETQSVTDAAEGCGGGKVLDRWQSEAKWSGEAEIDAASDESLQGCNGGRVARGNPAGQVVIDGPTKAGRSNEQRSDRELDAAIGLPRQEDAPSNNRQQAKRYSSIKVLPEQEPGEQGGK